MLRRLRLTPIMVLSCKMEDNLNEEEPSKSLQLTTLGSALG
ncbi:hypothetical protein Nhal_4016 (plasmid) [Nitrosococcus halophilus Nc 4]|uniref:Uncharacterized protein n=1 Tax=Nitrosococcus halophilus (strain Nc4) TaxID=472759 RepID=D5C5H0_NITHN|nr:hypothetical protein Nhal_4016 [Nitrosococcus halophilus Nc 4]